MSSKLITDVANIITTTLISLSQKYEKNINDLIDKEVFVYLAKLYSERKINNLGLIKALEYCIEKNITLDKVEKVVKDLNLIQIEDEGKLLSIVKDIINKYPDQKLQYLSGKTQVIGFFVGECMKASKGSGNPAKFKEILTRELV